MSTAFLVLSLLLLLMSLLASFRITHWSVQIFDYIRIQILFVQLLVLIGSSLLFKDGGTLIYLSIVFLLISILYQLYIILPYLSFRSIFTKKRPANYKTIENQISIVSSNVLQKNTEHHKLIELVKKIEPDILLTTETNKVWKNALKEIENDFTNNYKIALENRYGMHLYTRLKTIEIKEHFLMSDEIPSIEAHLEDNDGKRFVFWGVHPPPPSPTEKPTSRQKDAELMKLAKMIRGTGYPSVVVGDFNDVCWSRSSKQFAKNSKLIDVRIGRGILATFPVKPSIFRFPLDLIFSSKDIQVSEINILPKIGSDHLPIFAKLSVLSSTSTTAEKIDPDLKEKSDEIIKEGRKAVKEEG